MNLLYTSRYLHPMAPVCEHTHGNSGHGNALTTTTVPHARRAGPQRRFGFMPQVREGLLVSLSRPLASFHFDRIRLHRGEDARWSISRKSGRPVVFSSDRLERIRQYRVDVILSSARPLRGAAEVATHTHPGRVWPAAGASF